MGITRVGEVLTVLVIVASSGWAAQAPFVDSATRNGSFETGTLSPWSGFANPTPTPTILTDASIASDGQNYARLSAVGGAFTSQHVLVSSPALNPAQGNVVRIEFDARVPATGDVFNLITYTGFGSNPSDSIILSSASVEAEALTSAAWAHQVHDLTINPAKMASLPSMSFGIGFFRSPAVTGTTYVGWIDNVTMTQIPEPGGIAATALAITALAARRRAR